MTQIYLIRHAEAEGNLYRIAQGQHNSLLTDRGWRQVRALEKRFADVHIDAVYSSDLYRTCATASALYKPKGLPLQRSAALREICVGKWEQCTWGDIYREDSEQMYLFSTDPARWHVEGGEDPRLLLERVMREVQHIAAENEGKTVVVFSHGYAIRVLLATLQGYAMEEIGKSPTGDNTAVSLLKSGPEGLQVVFRDDNSHLQTPEYLANEKVFRRANALEPGLRFEPMCLPEQKTFVDELVAAVWREAGEQAPFGAAALRTDSGAETTLIGYSVDRPVGLVQMRVEKNVGWVTRLCVAPELRERGYGIQLVGQAVMHTRAAGGEFLRMALPREGMAMKFLTDYGFYPVEERGERVILEKDIRFDPEYLGDFRL
jgi:probable phosphoglycerate mutase